MTRPAADRIVAAVLASEPLPDDVVDALHAGLRAWLLSDGELDLARSVGLPGTPQAARRLARDNLLCQAAETFDGGRWARALGLSMVLAEFRARRWPRWRDLPDAPDNAAPVDRLLWRAMAASDDAPPATPEGLLAILKKFDGTR